MKRFLPFLSLLPLIIAQPAHADGVKVVELFTSQSCSSCPPADKVLGDFAKRVDVIALSCNVTYWNHLHWKDTLSQNFCTERQREYAGAMRSNRVYTPQMVINGQYEGVGSRKGKMGSLLDKADDLPKIEIADNQAELPALKKGDYTLTLITYGEEHTQSIPSGENRGRTVTYTNPVKTLKQYGSWDGEGKSLLLPSYDTPTNVVLIAQDARGHIKAAGELKAF